MGGVKMFYRTIRRMMHPSATERVMRVYRSKDKFFGSEDGYSKQFPKKPEAKPTAHYSPMGEGQKANQEQTDRGCDKDIPQTAATDECA